MKIFGREFDSCKKKRRTSFFIGILVGAVIATLLTFLGNTVVSFN